MARRLDELDGALLTGLAVACRTYYTALVEEGFTEPQAMILVEAWQRSWLEAARDDTRGTGSQATP